MRIAGAVMIGLSCAYMGFMRSVSMKKRCDQLSVLISALEMLETEISFNRTEIKKAFNNIDKTLDINGFFKTAAEMTPALGIEKAWRNAADKRLGYLLNADREIVKLLSARLGMTTAAEQLRQIEYVKGLLNGQLQNAQSEYKRLGRLYRSGGALAGAFIVLILI